MFCVRCILDVSWMYLRDVINGRGCLHSIHLLHCNETCLYLPAERCRVEREGFRENEEEEEEEKNKQTHTHTELLLLINLLYQAEDVTLHYLFCVRRQESLEVVKK